MSYNHLSRKYKVIEKIGEGSFSEVLKCEDVNTGIHYAAKRLKKLFKAPQDVLGCAEIIASFKIGRHPNILYMVEFHYDPLSCKASFIFELMDMSMYDFMKLKKRYMPEYKVKHYLYQILKGLDYLHKNGLFHRDIKPENILVRLDHSKDSHQREIVKLADLGSIRGVFSNPPYTEYISTRWYRSPECLLTIGTYGPKMDVWATGCVFYEMLRLRPLFPGLDEIDQLAKIHSVLGTPSPRILIRFKKRSRNFESFPKQKGMGLDQLLNNMTPEGQDVLKLMIQYDPDVRTNVGRLLGHKYFRYFREEDAKQKYKQGTDKSMGDFKASSFVSRSMVHPKHISNKYKNKRSAESDRSYSNSINRNKSLLRSKTVINISNDYCNKPRTHSLKEGVPMLLNQKNLRSLGADSNTLKPKILNGMKIKPNQSPLNRREPVSVKNHQTSSVTTDRFRKTTSNLPQIRKSFNEDKTIYPKKYQSKSFVHSRQNISGQANFSVTNASNSPALLVRQILFKRNKK